MQVTGPANKRKGIKKSPKPKAPHDKKKDGSFGNQTDYAAFAKAQGLNKTRGGASKVPGKMK